MSIDVKKIREDFPLIKNSSDVYFDNAATSQRPVSVIEAEKIFSEKYNANVMRGLYPLSIKATELYEDSRKAVQRFINAKSSREIIFTRNTTESINLVAYTWGLANLKADDEIVISIMEHHSDILPWQMVSRMTGAKLKYIDCEPDGSITDEALDKAFSEKTKLTAIVHVSNVLGCVNDIEKISKRAKASGAKLLIDGAQSVPHMKVDVQKLGADFLAFSGHKMLAPMGIGVLYGKEELLEEMPPFLTGGEMIESVTRTDAVFAELPHKFEAGTVNASGAYALKAAIDYYDKTGIENMQKAEHELTEYILKGMKAIPGVKVLGSDDARNHTGIISFTVDGVHPHDISEILASDGIDVRAGHHCAQPLLKHLKVMSSARASVMFYNTLSEADRFLNSVSELRRRMGYAE